MARIKYLLTGLFSINTMHTCMIYVWYSEITDYQYTKFTLIIKLTNQYHTQIVHGPLLSYTAYLGGGGGQEIPPPLDLRIKKQVE